MAFSGLEDVARQLAVGDAALAKAEFDPAPTRQLATV